MSRRWIRTLPERDDDGVLVDGGGRALARVYRFEHGPQKGRWYWTVMVGADGKPRNAGSGFEDTLEAAKAACERMVIR